MDLGGGAASFLHRKTPSPSDRFLGVFKDSCTEIIGDGDELSEDDVFWTGDIAENNHSSNIPATSSSFAGQNSRQHYRGKVVGRAENFGILAALPVAESDRRNFPSRSAFNHKASVSSSSRMIPTIPKKPPLDRQSSLKFNQSAPVKVPMMTEAMRRGREMRQFDDIDDYDDDGDGEMRPPHEVVASRHSPMVACSVLEGVGRTLKGRDLRQVRNAVWRKTDSSKFAKVLVSDT